MFDTDIPTRADLVLASTRYAKPLFPWLWPVRPTDLHQHHQSYSMPGQIFSAGLGFDQFSNCLPFELTHCLKDLAFVDRAMADSWNHRLQGFDLDLLITARDTAHHCLLTLPSYFKLNESQTHAVDELVYECCRLTSIIYVACVISPLLPGCPGIVQPLEELHHFITSRPNLLSDPMVVPVLLWSMFIGGIAGFSSPRRSIFVQILRELVSTRSITSLDQALDTCRLFIWSDCACSQGATTLWDYIAPGEPP